MKRNSPDWFADQIDVSRETLEKLECYADLLVRWNPKINLVSSKSLAHIWERHFLDSAQIADMAPKGGLWVDLGSGGGFPGMVSAVMVGERSPNTRFVLVESDQRKSAFLRAVARECTVSAEVISNRIEDIAPMGADVLTARALAPLSTLLSFADTHMKPSGRALFLKGEKADEEIAESLDHWSFDCEKHPSRTDVNSAILSIGDIKRV